MHRGHRFCGPVEETGLLLLSGAWRSETGTIAFTQTSEVLPRGCRRNSTSTELHLGDLGHESGLGDVELVGEKAA